MKNYLFFDASCVFMQVKFEVDFSRRFEPGSFLGII